MPDIVHPIAIHAENASLRDLPDGFPTQLASRMAARTKRPLGDPFGLTVFGVNLTRLAPDARAAQGLPPDPPLWALCQRQPR